ncbi:MAG: type II secretion system GspH family protein [Puniceicoccales bacterium]|jgi:prepilin-type N-terminal cleavage/methylation domain-containing protein|nr:type II secretion system GspH family protein [Puniceicoccales bacterium]
MDNRRENRGFTLIELIVVIAIIGVLMAFVLPSIGGALDRSRKSAAQNSLKQIANAYIMHLEDNGGFSYSNGNPITNIVDFALVLAQSGLLNDPNCYIFPSDAQARSTNKVKKNTIVHGDGKTFTNCWTTDNTDTCFSVFIVIDLPESCQPNTTPIAFSRGLYSGDKSGFIAFLDGKVKWFDDVAGKLMKYDMTATVNSITDALPPGCRVIKGSGSETILAPTS